MVAKTSFWVLVSQYADIKVAFAYACRPSCSFTQNSTAVWTQKLKIWTISDFHHEVDEFCTLLGYYAAYNGDSVPTFRDKITVQDFLSYVKMGPIGIPKRP